MRTMKKLFLYVFILIAAVIFSGCASVKPALRQDARSKQHGYNFNLNNTLAVYMVNDEKNNPFFCIPVQYVFEYQMQSFELTDSYIMIGGYKININRNNSNVYIYLNEDTDALGNFDSIDFKIIYIEEEGIIHLSDMNEPLPVKLSEDIMNHYYIFIERHLNENEYNAIINEYKKGNVSSGMEIWYDMIIDSEPQFGSGMLDTFEISVYDPTFGIPNLRFFKTMYLD